MGGNRVLTRMEIKEGEGMHSKLNENYLIMNNIKMKYKNKHEIIRKQLKINPTNKNIKKDLVRDSFESQR